MANNVIATGPAPPSRAAMAGSAFGEAFGSGVDQQRQTAQAVERFEPVRQAFLQQIGSNPQNPAQQLMFQVAQSPETFAQVMSDPNQLETIAQGMSFAQSDTSSAATQEEREVAEVFGEDQAAMLNALRRADEFEEAGDMERARIFRSRAADIAGVEEQELSEIGQLMREAGIDPDSDMGRRLQMQNIASKIGLDEQNNMESRLKELGFSDTEAAEIALGVPGAGIERDSATGDVVVRSSDGDRVIDGPRASQALRAVNEADPDAMEAARAPTPEELRQSAQENDIGLYQLGDDATGPINLFQSTVGNIAAIGGMDLFERQRRAVAAFRNAREDILNTIQGLSDTAGGGRRFGQAEIRETLNSIDISPGILDGGPALKDRLAEVDLAMRRRLEDARRAGSDPNLPPQAQAGARQAANAIENFLEVLNVPGEARRRGGQQDQGGQDTGGQQESGLQQSSVTVEDLQGELDSLPDEQRRTLLNDIGLEQGIPPGSRVEGVDPETNEIVIQLPDGREIGIGGL